MNRVEVHAIRKGFSLEMCIGNDNLEIMVYLAKLSETVDNSQGQERDSQNA